MTREDIENNVGYWQEKANLEYIRQRQEHGVNDPYMITEIDEAFDAGFDKGYQYARKILWFDAQGDNVPEYGREVIVIGRDGKVFYGHRPDPKEITIIEGKPYHAKTYDKNGWNWPDIALWLDVEVPDKLIDEITTEYFKENGQKRKSGNYGR